MSFHQPSPLKLADVVSLVEQRLGRKATRYSNLEIPRLDALVYMNLVRGVLAADHGGAELGGLLSQGWRSVSVLFRPMGSCSTLVPARRVSSWTMWGRFAVSAQVSISSSICGRQLAAAQGNCSDRCSNRRHGQGATRSALAGVEGSSSGAAGLRGLVVPRVPAERAER